MVLPKSSPFDQTVKIKICGIKKDHGSAMVWSCNVTRYHMLSTHKGDQGVEHDHMVDGCYELWGIWQIEKRKDRELQIMR